jgi:hypothetical protein
VPHELHGQPLPALQLRTYPVEARYGLVWVFFGDRELAVERPLPRIAELEGEDAWACRALEVTWRAHHSIVVDNFLDLSHVPALHRGIFPECTLTACRAEADRIVVEHQVRSRRGRGRWQPVVLGYDYPHLWSLTDEKVKHWCGLLPVDERTTRVFMLLMLRLPLLGRPAPRALTVPVLALVVQLILKRNCVEDGWAVELEQAGADAQPGVPAVELNPVIPIAQRLSVDMWEAHRRRASAGDILGDLAAVAMPR